MLFRVIREKQKAILLPYVIYGNALPVAKPFIIRIARSPRTSKMEFRSGHYTVIY